MLADDKLLRRRSVRLPGYDYRQAGAYFVTICIQNRRCLLGDVISSEMRLNRFGRAVEETFQWLGNHFEGVTLDCWIVMPNHVHAIVSIGAKERGGSRTAPTGQKPLGRIVGAFKTVSSGRIDRLRG